MGIRMILYMIIAASSVLLAYQIRQPVSEVPKETGKYKGSKLQLKNQVLFITLFLILFVFSAIRYGVGNDYGQYVKTFHEISVGGYVVTEIGFNLFVKLIYFLCGTEAYELVFAIFAFATIYLFLWTFWKYSVSFSFSFFLFMALGMYFQTFNTVRYYFVLAVVLIAMQNLLGKKPVSFVLMILAAALIHKSVLIVIPLYWLAKRKWKGWQVAVALILSITCMLLHSKVLQLALYLYPSYRNTIYLEGGISPSSIIRCVLVLLLTVFYYKSYIKKDEKLLFYAKLNFMAMIVYLFFSFLPVVTRIGYYLTISHVMYIPLLLATIEDERKKKITKTLVIIFAIGYFALFLLRADAPGVQLLPYRSWLFQTERYKM